MSQQPASVSRRSAATPGKILNSTSGQNRNRLAGAAKLSRSTASVPETGTRPVSGLKPPQRKRHKIDNRKIDIMSSSRNVISLPSAAPEHADSYSATDAGIAQALARAQENLLRQQRPDGHWCGELIVDSTFF